MWLRVRFEAIAGVQYPTCNVSYDRLRALRCIDPEHVRLERINLEGTELRLDEGRRHEVAPRRLALRDAVRKQLGGAFQEDKPVSAGGTAAMGAPVAAVCFTPPPGRLWALAPFQRLCGCTGARGMELSM